MSSATEAHDDATALRKLDNALAALRPTHPGSEVMMRERDQLRAILSDYLLPRVESTSWPRVVAVIGPGGAGKSTIVNALVGAELSPIGVKRPSTTNAVVLLHPAGRSMAAAGRLKERLPTAVDIRRLEPDSGFDPEIAVVDTPPHGVTDDRGVDISAAVASVADVCLFVTSPARYADAAAWRSLERLAERPTPTVFAMNRCSDDDVAAHFVAKLRALGHANPDLVVLPSVSGGLDGAPQVERLLGAVATVDVHDRSLLTSVMASVAARAEALATAGKEAASTLGDLEAGVSESFTEHGDAIVDELASGKLAWLGKHTDWTGMSVDLTGLVTRRAGLAAHDAARRWTGHGVGRAVIDAHPDLWRHGHDTTYAVQRRFDALGEDLSTPDAIGLPKRARRRARKIRDATWRLAIDESSQTSLARRYRKRAVLNAPAALGRMADVIRAAMSEDARRFVDEVGSNEALLAASSSVAAAASRLAMRTLPLGVGDGE